jgi:hypothetical protein
MKRTSIVALGAFLVLGACQPPETERPATRNRGDFAAANHDVIAELAAAYDAHAAAVGTIPPAPEVQAAQQ